MKLIHEVGTAAWQRSADAVGEHDEVEGDLVRVESLVIEAAHGPTVSTSYLTRNDDAEATR
jgi:hypothetical protein